MNIADTADNPLAYVPLVVEEETESAVLVVRVPCVAGMFLTATASESAQVLVREAAARLTEESFVDIATAPIDLSPYAGQTVEFDLKVAVGDVAGFERIALQVRVTSAP
ncbi:MAG: hypothetical protein WCF57_20360 [Pyrinomonadaceae bacterium]